MNKILFLFLTGIISNSLFSQNDCSIVEEYQDIFMSKKVKYGEHEFFIKQAQEVDESSCFADLINNNMAYFDYLMKHFATQNNPDLLSIEDSLEIQNSFIESLKSDSAFNNIMKTSALRVLDPSNFKADTVNIDELLNIAVKYFSIIQINEDGHYVGKVCTGINGIKETEKKRQPYLEAFSFSTVLNHYQDEDHNLYNEFVKAIKEIYKINLGVESDDKLLRAQGAMYMLMRNNEVLREVLQKEYQNKREYLPFVLEPDED